MSVPPLPLFIAIPLVTAFVLPILGKKGRSAATVLANLATLSLLFLAIFSVGRRDVYVMGKWPIPLGINLVLDGLSCLLLLAVSVVSFAAMLFSARYMEQYTAKPKYMTLFLLMVAGMNGVILSGDIFNLFVFLEIASISSYALVGFGCEHEELEASFKYMVLGSIAAMFILFAVGLVYGKQRGNEITKYSEHQVFKKWFPEDSHRNQNTPFCNNANSAIRKSLWEKYLYDETLTGLEDIDWAQKISRHDYKVVYQAEAEVIHVHDESYRSIYNRYRREAIALKRIMPSENFNQIDLLRLLLSNVLSDFNSAIQEGVFISNLLSIVAFRSAQFFGTYRGFRMSGAVSSDIKKRFYYPVSNQHCSTLRSNHSDDANEIDYSRIWDDTNKP